MIVTLIEKETVLSVVHSLIHIQASEGASILPSDVLHTRSEAFGGVSPTR